MTRWKMLTLAVAVLAVLAALVGGWYVNILNAGALPAKLKPTPISETTVERRQ